MNKLFVLMMSLMMLAPTMVQAAADGDSRDVSYDDLVNELASRKKKITSAREIDPLDDVKIHAGFGMVNSFSGYKVNGQSINRYENGMQISAGVDLFSPNWFAEAAFRNFGQTKNGSESHTLRELDLKIGHRAMLNGNWGYHIETGLANRELHLSDASNGADINDNTPDLLGAAGADLHLNSTLSIEFAGALHAPVVGQTADRGSWDFGMNLKVSL